MLSPKIPSRIRKVCVKYSCHILFIYCLLDYKRCFSCARSRGVALDRFAIVLVDIRKLNAFPCNKRIYFVTDLINDHLVNTTEADINWNCSNGITYSSEKGIS